MLRFSVLLFLVVLMPSTGKRQGCLRGAGHKLRPTPEKYLQECTLYAESACCSAGITEELAHSPVIKVQTTFWNRCGNLSPACETYMKKIECFYRCSPYIVHWAHPTQAAAISSVPICQRFCDNWYEACKSDHTCVSNWLTDWEIDDKRENHCKNECIPISEMYASGTDMCEKMWGDSLKVTRSPGLCFEMDKMDQKIFNCLSDRYSSRRRFSSSSSSSSSTSSSSSSSSTRTCTRIRTHISTNDVERFYPLRKPRRRELEE